MEMTNRVIIGLYFFEEINRFKKECETRQRQHQENEGHHRFMVLWFWYGGFQYQCQ